MYTDAVVEHFSNPRNVGTMENPNVAVKVGDQGCGDSIFLFLKIEDNVITDVKFKVNGCAPVVATSSMASTLIKGKSLEDALEINDERVAEALGGLPDEKMHCTNLSLTAIRAAVTRYMHSPEEQEAG